MATTPSAMTKCIGAVAQISRMLRWMPFQCRTFLGQPYFVPGSTPNMFFMLSVTPGQWWVLIFGIDTTKSDSSAVLAPARRFHSQAQVGCVAVGASDTTLFHFEAAVV